MRPPSLRELCVLPELALLPALLAAIDGLLASLQAQHGTLNDEWLPGDPATLRDARVLAHELGRARAALVRYARAVRRALREPVRAQEPLPF
jgi:hypothetical protein